MAQWTGKLILPIGPSGSGKSTLIEHIKKIFPEFVYPVTSTTRKKRPGEIDGVAYNFLSRTEFEKKIQAGQFLEWAEFSGNLYGTPKDEIILAIESGKTILREVEVQGARSIKNIFPKENLAIIYIDAGSWDLLKQRILDRTPISEKELEQRRLRYEDERTFINEANYVVSNYNGKLYDAQKDIENTILKIINLGVRY